MAGTALYQTVATLFLAQVFGVDIGPAGLVLVVCLAVVASIGSPGTPGVGIPAAGLALAVGVGRILDMCRTTVNITGDLLRRLDRRDTARAAYERALALTGRKPERRFLSRRLASLSD